MPLRALDGLDSLLSIVQMPAGVPVATVGIGGGRNAGLLAVRILAASDPALPAPGGRRFQADGWPSRSSRATARSRSGCGRTSGADGLESTRG